MDANCIPTCEGLYQGGIPDFNSYVTCQFCQECSTVCGIDTASCPVSCDGTGNCGTCASCAADPSGNCPDEEALCAADAECPLLFGCYNMCAAGDDMCRNDCSNLYANGIPAYNAVVLCEVCQECPMDCNGPAAGCP
jgi:hypothetical protein